MKLYSTLAVAAFALTALTSCDKSASKMDETPSANTSAPVETKIAYVEVDSIMSQYEFCKYYSLKLQKQGQNIQNTLTQKQQQLETAAANFQQKLEQNAYTRDQATSIQAQLQKQSNDLQLLNQRLTNEFQTETEKYNTALRDSIQHFLAVYNKDKKYTLIISKVGDNLLYADKSHDITNEVVAGLNKAYKPAATEKEEKAAKK